MAAVTLALFLAPGAAFARDDPETPGDPAAQSDTGATPAEAGAPDPYGVCLDGSCSLPEISREDLEHAPLDGEIVTAVDGFPERVRVHPLREAVLALRNGLTFRPERLLQVLGNHVLMRAGEVVAAFAHLAPGSVGVRVGQEVRQGAVIGRVGHTENSTSPHLHFQLMDSVEPLVANGLPCAFAAYEVRRGDIWVRVERGVPSANERIRSVDAGDRARWCVRRAAPGAGPGGRRCRPSVAADRWRDQ